MSKRILLAVSLVLAAGALLALGLTLRAPRSPAAPNPAADARAARPAAASESAESAPQASPAEVERASVETIDASKAARAALLEHARELPVSVRLPLGTPGDERVALFVASFSRSQHDDVAGAEAAARRYVEETQTPRFPRIDDEALELPTTDELECEVDAFGNAVARFAQDADYGVVRLSARYAYLREPLVVELATQSALVLEPELGAWFTASVTLPANLPADLERADLTSILVVLAGWSMDGGNHSGTTRVGDDLAFEFGGLHPRLNYVLSLTPAALAPKLEASLKAQPGEHLTRRFDLTLGARVRGVVVGDDGQALERARVTVEADGGINWMQAVGQARAAWTDARGHFDLRGITPGKCTIDASIEGRIDARSDELELADGQVVEELRIVLSSGAHVTGRVLWPDGSPAAGADVTATQKDTERRERNLVNVMDSGHEVKADDAGAFDIGGLAPRALALHATASRAIDGARAVWHARVEDVAPGSAVELTLVEPLPIRGRVVGADQQPLPRFSIDVDTKDGGAASNQSFAPSDGRFTVFVEPGEYTLAAASDGFTTSPVQPVTLPGAEVELVFVLLRGATIRGLVLAPDGAPVTGASIEREASGSSGRRRFRSDSGDVKSDAEGRFTLENVPAGAATLRANAEGFAPSEDAALVVEAAQVLADVRLVLRLGGRIEGEIYDAQGRPDAGRQIIVGNFGPGNGAMDGQTTSDAAGRFVVEHVAPGKCSVMATPDFGAMLGSGEELDEAALFAKLKMASIEVFDGQTVHVVLGAPPKAPVIVSGRVTEAGAPYPKGTVMVFAEGAAMLQSMKAGKIAADGRYSLTLDEPGDYTFIVGERMGDDSGVEYSESIPEVPEFTLDLAVPSCAILGRVRGRDGAPLKDVPVSYELEGRGSVLMLDLSRTVSTDEQGQFALRRLRPGSYTLRAGAAGFGDLYGDGTRYGIAVRTGLVVEPDKVLDGVEIRLDPPVTIAGKVLDAEGRPVADANVFVRDGAGKVLNPMTGCRSDAAGAFRFEGASAGSYTLSARAGALAARESAALHVTANAVAEVELRLEPGTLLRVVVEDAEGQPLRAGVRVVDDAGRDYGNMLGQEALETLMTEGFSAKEVRFGPLPAGKYRVLATGPDGASSNKPVTLNGQAERTLRVRLKD